MRYPFVFIAKFPILSLVVLAAFISFVAVTNNHYAAKAEAEVAGKNQLLTDQLGCYSTDAVRRIFRQPNEDDRLVITQSLFQTGECKIVPKDTVIVVEKRNIRSADCVLIEGETSCIWVETGHTKR